MKVLFHIFGIPVHFFGVMIALGILAGIFVAYLEVKRKKLDVGKLFDIALYSIISAVVGARVFYILFYDLSYYLNNPAEIIKINEGGLSIHGGLLGASIFAFFYFRKNNKLSFYKYADAIAPGIILGQGIGRIGCDVFGKVMSIPRPWGIERQDQLLHPAQVYEFLLNYAVFFILWRKRKSIKYDGQLFIWYVILFAINRSIVELFRSNPSVVGWFSISHLLSVLLIIGAVIFMIFAKKKRVDNPNESNGEAVIRTLDWVKDVLITLALIAVSLIIFYTIQA
ncbi:prolipoprotein diacylglyceryl transferase [Clostridium thermosuccinogenes]|uniref:Phosphatidylglycerol--prolipoprotein diacylglyceryl transferase n=1 Tax=Clostridium thermosuccinogenes TaxID=84032 RepID=A0A2K2FNM4_9CLOT|nr:prolipoprotein diacylglyceryl transferase [Pseudoclostridium thermosuccinogenes]AUS97411.1 prolipoprotein diacylglyceryl transferase [Pseudoclostridium thermosuccinogenes]PNT98238.1 prolipoprotein diacylglyceryl transferase [Pseudoclostridium thermosuccinogenes]PNU00388.1 prolipoprotein diacylglyceryl transferase [Pseudoclostridium thermosuccinogenes]